MGGSSRMGGEGGRWRWEEAFSRCYFYQNIGFFTLVRQISQWGHTIKKNMDVKTSQREFLMF